MSGPREQAIPQPEPRFVELPDGARLAYRAWGDGPPAYLVHGGPGGSGAYWPRAVPWLGASRAVFAIDLRGHGLSSRTPPYSIARFAEDLDAFARAMGHDAPALVGHSYGALVALEAAARFPRFERLVVVGGFSATWRTLARRRGFGTKLALGASLAAWNVRRPFRPDENPREFLRALLRKAAPLFHGASDAAEEVDALLWESVIDPLDAVAPLQADLLTWSVERRLPDLRAPTLVVAGARDGLAAREAPALARRIPDARLVILDEAGHSPFFDAPDAFRRLVEPFLAGRKPHAQGR